MNSTALTWQQVALCALLLTGVIVSYKILGEVPSMAMLAISSVINLLLGRAPQQPPTPPEAQ